ncbi:solute carrier family 40 member 1-like [Penaeus japonicus]|uniref:solute carrier family 40 member 1-like n=1 Tax=Penaeus japonicus TaxID=27405 RepID=UPI001C7165B7|nr:solute carrier family 40 member 1-like [Penaeus japonicus]XP_042865053.1 solute carrier family 40 member 1-like [Penaeus japonicus]XP_042865054.1 solute carrier family 40 member 1-like [Penaeus japonicus]XP_042865056.1 solute carrier family 40 member 1-like [Penaeus japonicus]
MTVTSMEVSSPNDVNSSASDEVPKESYKKLEDPGGLERNMDNLENNEAIGETGANTEGGSEEGTERKKTCCSFIKTAQFQVYASHFLSSWGDRMWMFAGGLFLLEVTPGSLRLAAVYGAALAVTVILCGAPVGRWVDTNSRLRTAQISLSVQNLMVCICAALLVVITTQRHYFTAWDGWSLVLAEAGVIFSACLAQIGTLGCKLAIEKDWIIVICGRDKTTLAKMNSVLRTVDLSTEVLAPVIVGTVMTAFGLAAGGIVIAAWNVGSLLVEYGLLHHLYNSSPELQKPKNVSDSAIEVGKDGEANDNENPEKKRKKRHIFIQRIISAWGAWKAYMSHPVRDAGLGLAFLFMTVLAFDNYSRAFVYESGVSETVLGILTAVASMSGILGSLAFPFLRKRVGISKTGLVGFGFETVCLSLCVASVFVPGSPFDASALLSNSGTTEGNNSTEAPSYLIYNISTLSDGTNISLAEENGTVALDVPLNPSSNESNPESKEEIVYTSVILLLTGIITSRFGLWLADLTVTQILQEGVEEGQRGAINGVQSSLNQSFDLLRSILIIILPIRATFGFLIILSFIFVSIAWILFAVYARRNPTPLTTPEGEQLKPMAV